MVRILSSSPYLLSQSVEREAKKNARPKIGDERGKALNFRASHRLASTPIFARASFFFSRQVRRTAKINRDCSQSICEVSYLGLDKHC